MKLIGKTIKIYVRGNTSRALRSIEIVNWSGKAFLGSRNHVKQLKEIAELSETGIYFLLSTNEESGLTDIYIGETDYVSQRINQHTGKDWWDTFVVFISRDLTKAHVRFLESKLYELAKQSVSSLKVMNDGVPTGSRLPEPDICAMEEFASNMIFTLETLGLGLFQTDNVLENEDDEMTSKTQVRTTTPKNYSAAAGMEFYITLPKEVANQNEQATMTLSDGAFVLKKGSYVRFEKADSFEGHSYYEMWLQIINSNAVERTENPKLLRTTRNLEFKSPSAAAAFVRARATNGRKEWKRVSDHKSFIECETEEDAA